MALKKKKTTKKKPKSELALKNDIRARIRRIYSWYGSNYIKAKNDAKISYGLYKCSVCNEITKKIEIDHDPAVIRPHEQTKDVSLDEYFDRVFNGPVVAKCPSCHAETTQEQKDERMRHRKSKDL